jgi:hypothetical protein
VSTRAGLFDMETLIFLRLPGLEFRLIGHPAVVSRYTGRAAAGRFRGICSLISSAFTGRPAYRGEELCTTQ